MPPKATLTMESSRQKRESTQTGLSTTQEGRGEPGFPPALRLRNGVGDGGYSRQDGGGGGLNELERFSESGLVA